MLLICSTCWWAWSFLAIKPCSIWSFLVKPVFRFLVMFAERCFSGIVHNLLETSPATCLIILYQALLVAGVSQFSCVQLYGFHNTFLIVFFLILMITLDLNIWWSIPQFSPRIVRVIQTSILSRHLVIMKYIICPCGDRSRRSWVHPSV